VKIRRIAPVLVFGAVLGAAVAFAGTPPGGFPPDPPGHASKKQWVFDVSFKNGKASITRVSSNFLNNPTPTARMMGRFAVEFWVGKELLDRIRFDVPLLDRDPKDQRRGPLRGPNFANVSARLTVRMADNPRATFVQIVDRSTGDVQRFAWPPESDGKLVPVGAPAAPASGAAGARDGGPSPADGGADAGAADAR